MTVFEGADDLGQLWSLITELSEQLNQNRNISVSLYTQAGDIKVCMFVLFIIFFQDMTLLFLESSYTLSDRVCVEEASNSFYLLSQVTFLIVCIGSTWIKVKVGRMV